MQRNSLYRSDPARVGGRAAPVTLVAACMLGVAHAPLRAQDNAIEESRDAFGVRVGLESLGLYSESLVRGFNLQEAGNYRMAGVYFVRAAAPSDVILRSSQVRIGPSALALDFPAPSGVVAYRLNPGDRDRSEIELGFQHLGDSNPRPYARAFLTRRFNDGRASVAAGWIGADSARYIYGNEAQYQGYGVVPRFELGERWLLTAFASRYDQLYQADCGFVPASGVMQVRPDRLRYLGQPWSRFDTHNSNHGAILSTRPQSGAWNVTLSSLLSEVDRPRSDFNIFTEVAPDGGADAITVVARDRRISSWAHEGTAARNWSSASHNVGLKVMARHRDSDYLDPIVQSVESGRISLLERPRVIAEPIAPGAATRSSSGVEQYEAGVALRYAHRSGLAANVGLRRVSVDEVSRAVNGVVTSRSSANWLYNASITLPMSDALTAFVATTRGIEEAGAAPQNAANRFEVLSPIVARQFEVGLQWRPTEKLTVIATLFDIEKPEPGFDADNVYRYLTTVRHRGVEASISAEASEHLSVLVGGAWLDPELKGEAVSAGLIGDRPVGRSSTVALASFNYRIPRLPSLSVDVDATYNGSRPASADNRLETPGYTLWNVGARYMFTVRAAPAVLRLRIHNATDAYAWYASPSGIQSWEPERRVMLSVTLGE